MLRYNIEFDDVCYLVVFLVCSYFGLIKEGEEFFLKLLEIFEIKFRVEYYVCVVDLLGRVGCLKEGKYFIDMMFVKLNVGIW